MKSNDSIGTALGIGLAVGVAVTIAFSIAVTSQPDSRCLTLPYVLPYKAMFTDGKCLINIDADRWVPADQFKLVQK